MTSKVQNWRFKVPIVHTYICTFLIQNWPLCCRLVGQIVLVECGNMQNLWTYGKAFICVSNALSKKCKAKKKGGHCWLDSRRRRRYYWTNTYYYNSVFCLLEWDFVELNSIILNKWYHAFCIHFNFLIFPNLGAFLTAAATNPNTYMYIAICMYILKGDL